MGIKALRLPGHRWILEAKCGKHGPDAPEEDSMNIGREMVNFEMPEPFHKMGTVVETRIPWLF